MIGISCTKSSPEEIFENGLLLYRVDFYLKSAGHESSCYILSDACTPRLLCEIALLHGAMLCVCPKKYGCRQFRAYEEK